MYILDFIKLYVAGSEQKKINMKSSVLGIGLLLRTGNSSLRFHG